MIGPGGVMDHRQFFDRIATEWDELEVEETHTRLREIVAGLGIETGSTALDVGTGTGVLVPLLLEATDGKGQIVALDFSGEMLRRAKAKGHPGAYVQGDAQRLPFSAETFDWVICNAVFPHFPDKRRALGKASRVLRQGGWLVICHTASRQEINEFHRSVGGIVAHDTIPDENAMRQLLREAELGEVRVWDDPDRYVALAQREGWYSAPSERNR
ncbi:MAG: methyltransferase domain-containing protein [Anaerolineae bacterium]